LVEHDLFRKPVSSPDQVRARLFRDHALNLSFPIPLPTAGLANRTDLVPHRFVLNITLLWLIGNALRVPILAVPPVIPQIHNDLHMSATAVGVLGGLPVVLLAAAALPGSLVIARLGPARAVVAGLLIAALAGALRGAVANVAWLYAMTVAMAAGIAIAQPAMPALVRAWIPDRIAFATAAYTNGFLTGGTFAVMLTIPVVLPLVRDSWQLALAFWSLPIFAVAVLVLFSGPPDAQHTDSARPRWWPDWKDGLVWRLGLTFGSVNAMYFGSNTFLPDYLTVHGRPDLISAALTALNFGQLPASFLLLGVAHRLERRVWPFLAFGLICLVSIIGIVTTASAWTVVWAAMLGFAAAGVFVLVLALPPLLRAPADVARISAAMMTVSYTLAMTTAVASGAAWDLSGVPAAAFAPIAACAALLLCVPATISFERPNDAH
jgi:MFS transporter, CP family, cyanate transporter